MKIRVAAVVDDDRQAAGTGDGLDVGHQAVGGSGHQVGRQHQEGVSAGFLGNPGGGEGVPQRSTRPGHHGNPPGNDLDGGRHHGADLIDAQGMEFTRAAGREDAAGAKRKAGTDVFLEQFHVNGSFGRERGDGEEQYAVEFHGRLLASGSGSDQCGGLVVEVWRRSEFGAPAALGLPAQQLRALAMEKAGLVPVRPARWLHCPGRNGA